MSTAQTLSSTNRPFTRRAALQMLIGAAVGFCVAFGFIGLLEHLHLSPKSLSVSDLFALWVGITFVAISLVSFYLSVNRKQLAKQLEGDFATLPATHQEVIAARLQGFVLLLAGGLMIAPSLLEHFIAGKPAVAQLSYAVIVILFAVQTVANLRIWRISDEFMRQTIAGICALTFAIGQGMLFLWAAAEHLHLVHTGSSWSIFTIEMLLYVMVSSYVTVRSRVR
jgi:multidrug transporter EmrE-like cation transporter